MATKSLPRGIRNNNPGNINFVNQPGAKMEPKSASVPVPRFAAWPTMDQGVIALAYQIKLYFGRRINTPAKIISQWAPPTENNTKSYIASVSQQIGAKPDQQLTCDVATVSKLVMAISIYECGHNLPFTIRSIQPLVERALAPPMV